MMTNFTTWLWRLIWFLPFFGLVHPVSATPKAASRILEEGKLLYRLEKASWYSTDDFLARFQHKVDSIGGYVSYQDEQKRVVTIFYSKETPARVLVRYFFDPLPQKTPLSIDTLHSSATRLESDLIALRNEAMRRVMANSNKFYTFYENTQFNFIPLIRNKKKRVFVLTGPQLTNTVLIGNDYVLTFNARNRFVKEEQIHKSLLQFSYTSGNPEKKLESTHHSHVLSHLITSTDICTLLLYKDFVEWKTHYVISRKYVSIFNLQKETLAILDRKAWDKITKVQRG